PVALAVEAQLDAVVDEALAVEPVGEPGVVEELDGALLEDARADAVLDVLAAARLEHDRVDSLEVEEVRKQQPGRLGPDDSDLCPHLCLSVCLIRLGNRSIANPRRRAPPPRPRTWPRSRGA